MFFVQIAMVCIMFVVAFISFYGEKQSQLRGTMILSLVGIIIVSLLMTKGAFLYTLLAAIGVAYLLHKALMPKVVVAQYVVIDEDEKPEHIDLKI